MKEIRKAKKLLKVKTAGNPAVFTYT